MGCPALYCWKYGEVGLYWLDAELNAGEAEGKPAEAELNPAEAELNPAEAEL